MRRMLGIAAFAALSIGAAFAWTPPNVGKACAGQRGPGATLTMISGNFLGGRVIQGGMVDQKSFQACFKSVEACEHWLAGHAKSFAVQPGYARCTPVVLR